MASFVVFMELRRQEYDFKHGFLIVGHIFMHMYVLQNSKGKEILIRLGRLRCTSRQCYLIYPKESNRYRFMLK